MVSKPLSNITNVRGRAQKCGQNRAELICVDFWESYDPDEVCSSGFGLIGTASFTVARLCFLCGSAGKEKDIMALSRGTKYAVFLASFVGFIGVTLYPIAISPMIDASEYKKIQKEARKNIKQDEIQPGSCLWSNVVTAALGLVLLLMFGIYWAKGWP